MIKLMNLVGETKVVPRKPFVLFPMRSALFDDDIKYIMYLNNDVNQEIIHIFFEDDLKESYVKIVLLINSMEEKIDFLLKNIKGLPDVKVEKYSYFGNDDIDRIKFEIPIRYFRIYETKNI